MHAILTYHSIDPSGSSISLSEGELRGHVAWLASRKVQAVPLEWIAKVPEGRDALVLTCDDGYVSFGEKAWTLFKHNDLPVTLFVATDRVGGDNRWGGRGSGSRPVLPLLDWDGLVKLVEKGLVLGSRGRTHADLTKVTDTQLAEEVEGSAAEIERRTGVRPTAFSYPFGKWDERVAAAVARTYVLACTSELRALAPGADAHRLPRLDVRHYRSAKHLAAWDTGAFRRRLWLRALVS
jgi:peptidoglycan/xylan/chitin deacetylase (PgdA/CDA1 family)